MDAESLFSIVFVAFVAFFPFKLAHWVGTDLFHKNEFIRKTLPRMKDSVGTIVGYTKTTAWTDSTEEHLAIIEHKINETDVIWAENSRQTHKDYTIGQEVNFSYDSDDPRYVTIGDYRMLMKGAEIMRFILIGFSLIVSCSLLFYFKFPSPISYLIVGAYLTGLIIGYRFGPFMRWDLKAKKAERARRDKRLADAQKIGDVPCDLKI